jgi:hypothetical protein
VDVLLVVMEKLILLTRECCWLECYLKPMCRFGWSLDIFVVTPVNFLDKVECVLELRFLSALLSAAKLCTA